MLNLPLRSNEELNNSITQTLAMKPASPVSGVWLFVYGLLAKDPHFSYTVCHKVVLEGWERRFHLSDPKNRGTPEMPGLTLGLAPAGSCAGLAYLIPEKDVFKSLIDVWKQEMLLPFYIPTWIRQGERDLLTMVTDPHSPAYQPTISAGRAGWVISRASGEAGSNKKYLFDVRHAFAGEDIIDPYLEEVVTEMG